METRQGNHFVLVMMDSYTKLTEAIPTTNTDAPTVACIFLDCRAAYYDILCRNLIENGAQFVSKFSFAVCSTIRVESSPSLITAHEPVVRRDFLTPN